MNNSPTNEQIVFVFLSLSTAIFAMAYAFPVFGTRYPDFGHLGGEYYNIANAIAQGRGFSDPFLQGTGPTSWMPPLFCIFLAGLILILKSKLLVAIVVAVITNLSWSVVGTIVYYVSARHCIKLPAVFSVAVYLVWLCAFYSAYFLLAHDIWFIALFVALLVLQVSNYHLSGKIVPHHWGIVGGLSVLASPTLGTVWGAVTVSLAIRERRLRKSMFLAASLVALIASPWMVRNAVTFHRFIPTKSNLGYDLYQAHRIDDDGVYDSWSFQHHPYGSPRAGREYAREGEIAFVDRHAHAFAQSVRRRPGEYIKRVCRRFVAITLVYRDDGVDSGSVLFRDLRLLLYALPFLFAMTTLLLRTKQGLLSTLRLSYLCYVTPYALFAFQFRHVAPIVCLLVLCITFSIDRFWVLLTSQAHRVTEPRA